MMEVGVRQHRRQSVDAFRPGALDLQDTVKFRLRERLDLRSNDGFGEWTAQANAPLENGYA